MNRTDAQVSYKQMDPMAAWFKPTPLKHPSERRKMQMRYRAVRSIGLLPQPRYHKGWSAQVQKRNSKA